MHTRRGSIYLMVLFTTVAAVAMVLGALELQRAARAHTRAAADGTRARALATGAVEIGLQLLNDDPTRATLAKSGAWLAAAPVGRGTADVLATDPVDGDPTDDPADALVLRGTGTTGGSVQYVQATATPVFTPVAAVSGSLVSAGALSFTNASFSATNQASGTGADATNAIVLAALCTGTTATGSTYSGTRSVGSIPAVPTLATASTPYTAGRPKGDFGLLAFATFQKGALGPGDNPFGLAPSADGVYVVDCYRQTVTIKNCRIVGTLVLLNAVQVNVSESVAWEPATKGYPALIVEGDLDLSLSAVPLSESGLGVNLNAPVLGLSASDSSLDDVYTSMIRGLVYVSGKFTTGGATTVQGAVLATDKANVIGSLIIKTDPDLATHPPPGFRTGPTMVVQPGSWVQVVK